MSQFQLGEIVFRQDICKIWRKCKIIQVGPKQVRVQDEGYPSWYGSDASDRNTDRPHGLSRSTDGVFRGTTWRLRGEEMERLSRTSVEMLQWNLADVEKQIFTAESEAETLREAKLQIIKMIQQAQNDSSR